MFQCLAEGLRDVVGVKGRPAGDEGRAGGVRQERQAERRFVIAGRRRRGVGVGWRRRRHLSAGHAVSEIVHADDHEVHVPARGVNEVIAADAGEVAVAADDHDLEFGIGEFQARGEGNGAAMRGVEGVEFDVAGDPACAADARDHGDLVHVVTARLDRFGEAGDDRADAAARTPDVRHPLHAEEIRHRVFLAELLVVGRVFRSQICTAHFFAPSLMAARISSGSWTAPPQELTLITLHCPAAQRSTSRTTCP